MVIMNILRMLVDTSFYCAFAGLVARICGGNGAFVGTIISCICFGLSYLGGCRRWLRLAFLMPMAFSWIIHRGSIADCILLIPTAVYIIWLVWQNDYFLNHDRQQHLFGVFWKVLLAVIPIGMLLGGSKALTAITVPYAIIVLICSVLLMRALRHEPEIYCQKRYQVVNISAVAAVVFLAGLFSTKTFLNACVTVLKTIYTTLIQPVLEFILNIILYLISGILKLFSWISFKRESEEQEYVQMNLNGTENIFGEEVQLKEPGELLRILGIILIVVAAVVLLVLFFRWMNRRHGNSGAQAGTEYMREDVKADLRITKKRETSPVRKVRALYCGFLKWCLENGIRIERSSTSLDVHRQVVEKVEISAQIRKLYIEARYAQNANQDSVRAMKDLCSQIKKSQTDK